MIRAVDKWLGGYLRSVRRRPDSVPGKKHLLVAVTDHFEPFRGGASRETALARVRRWVDEYPVAMQHFRDAGGNYPKHTFFYPEEEYDQECMDLLSDLCREGYGEVEIHLHHRDDTQEGLRHKLTRFRDLLNDRHGLMGRDLNGNLRYGFIHGNWALCNSRPDGDWCGVDEELSVLKETGCYADFTFPSAPSPTQPRMVNAIYRASDTPGKPRAADYGELVSTQAARDLTTKYAKHTKVAESHDDGSSLDFCNVDSQKGASESHNNSDTSPVLSSASSAPASTLHRASDLVHGLETSPSDPASRIPHPASDPDGLMLIQGPLGLNWGDKKYGVLPRLENAEISGSNRPSAERIDLWLKQHIHVVGAPEWVFLKLHTHGCVQKNADVLLNSSKLKEFKKFKVDVGDVSQLTFHETLHERLSGSDEFALHYVSAREMYNLARAAEDGKTGDPEEFRNYEILPPC